MGWWDDRIAELTDTQVICAAAVVVLLTWVGVLLLIDKVLG